MAEHQQRRRNIITTEHTKTKEKANNRGEKLQERNLEKEKAEKRKDEKETAVASTVQTFARREKEK